MLQVKAYLLSLTALHSFISDFHLLCLLLANAIHSYFWLFLSELITLIYQPACRAGDFRACPCLLSRDMIFHAISPCRPRK